jgi:hypothetical protein
MGRQGSGDVKLKMSRETANLFKNTCAIQERQKMMSNRTLVTAKGINLPNLKVNI